MRPLHKFHLLIATVLTCVTYMWVRRSRAAVRDREMEARAFEQSEKRLAVQAGELQLPAAEISRLFGGFIPPHLLNNRCRQEK